MLTIRWNINRVLFAVIMVSRCKRQTVDFNFVPGIHTVVSHNARIVKQHLHLPQAIILSTLLYSADVWPLTATLTKRLNATHHRWQRSILGISWKDRVTNEEVRVRTGQHSMDDILSERRLRWLDHVIPCDYQHCTGRFQGLREVQVVRVQTGGAQSTRTC